MNKIWESDDFVGERVCLDFVNTVSHWSNPAAMEDLIPTYDEFLGWFKNAQCKDREETGWVLAFEEADEEIQARVMCDAGKLRKNIYEVFHAFANNRQPEMSHISAVYEALAATVMFVEPVERPKDLVGPANQVRILKPSGLLYPIAHSAARLLVDNCLCYIKECADQTCEWVFLDCSKSHRRRWCSMQTCGNRAKARKHYRKKCEAPA